MLGSFHSVDPHEREQLGDVGFLPLRDRACLRILRCYDVATTQQLTFLVYRRRQRAQLHLQRLYRYRMLERTALPPLDRGGAPLVFRISSYGRRRLKYPALSRPEAGTQLRHSLHVVDTVVALARPRPDNPYPLQGWLSPRMSAGMLQHVLPDALLPIQLGSGSGVLALELDEGTEHRNVIEQKLVNYGYALNRSGWHLLFVVPDLSRLRWLRRRDHHVRGRSPGLADAGWVATFFEIRRDGLDALVTPIDGDGAPQPLAMILNDATPRRIDTPIPSDEWLMLLAHGGGEDDAFG